MGGIITTMIKLLAAAMLMSLSKADNPPPIKFYGLEINTGAPITKFETILVVPAVTPDNNPSSVQGLRSMWPGLEPDPVSCLFQNVLSNLDLPQEKTVDHAWYFFPYWCCHPARDLVDDRIRLYPGDQLQNTYQWNPETRDWYQNWVVQPGTLGHAGGLEPLGGGLGTDGHFDTKYTEEKWPPMVKAILSIEIQGEGEWDFGEVEWRNVIIEAQTRETKWCTDIPDGKDDFKMRRTQPVATTNTQKGLTTCYIAYISFLGLN